MKDLVSRGPRYAVVATSQYYANVHAEEELMRYCGMTREQAQQAQQQGSCDKVVLRRNLTDTAAQYLTAHLNPLSLSLAAYCGRS